MIHGGPVSCISCGARREDEPEDPQDLACNSCFAESEAKAAAELVKEFRWLSRDWLKCHGCSGTGERHDAHCYCHIGQAMAAAEGSRFTFVKALPALAVCGLKHMAASGIDPQERVAK